MIDDGNYIVISKWTIASSIDAIDASEYVEIDTLGLSNQEYFNSYNHKLYDTHSNAFEAPILDKINNYKLTYYEIDYSLQQTKIKFKRDLLACDEQDYDIEYKYLRHNILLSYNSNDYKLNKLTKDINAVSLDKYMSIHEETEVKLISLALSDEYFFGLGDNFKDDNADFLVNLINDGQIVLNTSPQTQYEYKLFNITQDLYIIGAEIVHNKLYPRINHHIALYDCTSVYLNEGDEFLSRFNETSINGNYYITSDTGSTNEMECNALFAIFPGTGIELPNGMYLLLEKGVYVLQYHFDFIYVTDGSSYIYNDTNGAALYGINDIGKYRINVGGLMGVLHDFTIKSGVKDYEISFLVNSACTASVLPPTGISMIYITAHMHEYGQTFEMQRIRNGVSETVYQVKQFDFERHFATPTYISILPNDSIILKCTYTIVT